MAKSNLQNFIGSGLIFPITLDSGFPKVETGFELIESNIQILLSWPKFQRFYLVTYGSRIEELLEEPNDRVLLEILRRFTVETITDWEKRVSLIAATVSQNEATVDISLRYKITNTDLEKSFVFPFYEKIIY